uniref:Uncharacterized protein n=1 Tax=Phlebotomus kandelakii TaxID=1109342 RepID=A0A6B2EMG4_9DIPT
MGGSHSEPRSYKVTPDYPQSDLSMEYITITKDVLRRLERLEWERKSPLQDPPPKPSPLPAPRRDFRRPINFRDREDALNDAIRRNEETFRRIVRDLEQKLQRKVEEDSQNPVKCASDVLVNCLRKHPGETLRCREEVQVFNRQIFNLAVGEGKPANSSSGSA